MGGLVVGSGITGLGVVVVGLVGGGSILGCRQFAQGLCHVAQLFYPDRAACLLGGLEIAGINLLAHLLVRELAGKFALQPGDHLSCFTRVLVPFRFPRVVGDLLTSNQLRIVSVELLDVASIHRTGFELNVMGETVP